MRRLTVVGICLTVAAALGCAKQPVADSPKVAPAPEGAVKTGEFFGVSPSAPDTIAFVIDRSGSMTDTIVYVKHALKKSISRLKPNQKFYVVFFSSGPPVAMPAGKAVPATETNKQNAYEFIDNIVPIGQNDPDEALQVAFGVSPDVIYLLTDGEFDRKIVGRIDKLNSGRGDRKVVVNTVCFIYSNGEKLLKEIAKRNGGTYKYVGQEELESMERK